MKFLLLFLYVSISFTKSTVFAYSPIQSEETLTQKIKITDQLFSFDSIVRKASTPGYLVLKESDFSIFKTKFKGQLFILDSLYCKNLSELKALTSPNGNNSDLQSEIKASYRLNNLSDQSKLTSSKIPYIFYAIFAFFVLYSILISLKFYSVYSQDVTTQEQLEIVSEDFENYKKNTIHRERKLKRELLDLQEKYSSEP
jgi:hypothetical protein